MASSDPGLTRLRTALRVILAVSSALLLVVVIIMLLGQSPLVPTIMAAVVAMLASMTMNDSTPGGKAITAAIAPIAAGVGATVSILTAPIPALSTTAFILVMFAAVWMRRFGARFFADGFLLWMGFFMPLFIGAKLPSLPWLIRGAAISAGWVWLLRVTLLKDRPHRTLRRMVDAFWTRTWQVMQTASERLETPDDGRVARRLWSRRAQITEVALLIDGQLADVTAAPIPRRFQVRQWLIEVEMACDEVCGAANELAVTADVPSSVRLAAQNALLALARGQWDLAQTKLEKFAHAPGSGYLRQMRRLAVAAQAIEKAGRLRDERGTTGEPSAVQSTAVELIPNSNDEPRRSPASTRSDDPGGDENFTSAVTLFGGNLPGTAGTAKKALEEGPRRRWTNGGRLSLTTRQAFQAALAGGIAIAAGHLVSGQRWYWAVIAAFVAFAGTSNSGETVRRTSARVGGTLIGLALAVLFANLTVGNTALAAVCVFICIFCAFYIQRISYAAMTVFITIMLGQLYVLLGSYSGHTLVLRLEETAVGAAIGVAVSLLVLPTGTRAAAKIASSELFKLLGQLLGTLADRVDPAAQDENQKRSKADDGDGDGKPAATQDDGNDGDGNEDPAAKGAPADLLASARGIDAQLNQVIQVNRAVSSTTPSSSDRAALQHRLDVLSAVCSAARGLAVDVQTARSPSSTPLAQVCRRLAELVTGFPADLQGREAGAADSASGRLAALDEELAELADDGSEIWLRRSRRHLQRMSGALKVLLDGHSGSRPAKGPPAPQHLPYGWPLLEKRR
ncbi:FUSC family protein [Paenarthrobacter sp. Z7-10]|uniref:FUSC family protein n=1 Tax=Paenarthrobacter sp. Z7-10 TaxID=2787635 RepID=UPI0022A9BC8E|nr:FUSC family protein [Paenarthrobacter sp. Z7-10]MCZ2402214.1 FUSC family protein [Paenarthrobacter sp. Z7-10]